MTIDNDNEGSEDDGGWAEERVGRGSFRGWGIFEDGKYLRMGNI